MLRMVTCVTNAVWDALTQGKLALGSLARSRSFGELRGMAASDDYDVALVSVPSGRSGTIAPCGADVCESEFRGLQTLLLPIVLLTLDSLPSLRAAFDIARTRQAELAIFRADGTLEGVTEAAERAAATRVGARVLARLHQHFPRLQTHTSRRLLNASSLARLYSKTKPWL